MNHTQWENKDWDRVHIVDRSKMQIIFDNEYQHDQFYNQKVEILTRRSWMSEGIRIPHRLSWYIHNLISAVEASRKNISKRSILNKIPDVADVKKAFRTLTESIHIIFSTADSYRDKLDRLIFYNVDIDVFEKMISAGNLLSAYYDTMIRTLYPLVIKERKESFEHIEALRDEIKKISDKYPIQVSLTVNLDAPTRDEGQNELHRVFDRLIGDFPYLRHPAFNIHTVRFNESSDNSSSWDVSEEFLFMRPWREGDPKPKKLSVENIIKSVIDND